MSSYILPPCAINQCPPASLPCFKQPVTDIACLPPPMPILSCAFRRIGNRLRNTRGAKNSDTFFTCDIIHLPFRSILLPAIVDKQKVSPGARTSSPGRYPFGAPAGRFLGGYAALRR